LKEAERWLESTGPMKAQPVSPSIETFPERSRGMIVVDQEQFKRLPATIAVGRAYIAQALGNIPDTVRYANRALELVSDGEHLRRGQASMLLGITYWASGDLEAADRSSPNTP
jgi:LuxR family maltose regulon positive regulatory protein